MNKWTVSVDLCFVVLLLAVAAVLLGFSKRDKAPLPHLGLSASEGEAFRAFYTKADSLLWNEEFDSAQIYLDELRFFYERGNDSLRWLVDALSDHINGYAWSGEEQYDSAVVYFEKAEENYRKLGRWEMAAFAQLDQALTGYFDQDLPLMESALDRASSSVKVLPFDHEFQEAVLGLKSVLYNATGDYDKAVETAQQELSLLLARGKIDSVNLAISYSNLGVFFDNRGDLDRAIDYYLASIRLNRETGEYSDAQYGNLSVTYSGKGQYEQALEYNRRHIAELQRFTREEKSPIEFRKAYLNRCGFFLRTAQYDSAEVYLFRALDLDRKLDRSDPLVYNNIGVLYRKTGQFEKAIDFNRRARDAYLQRYGFHHPRVALGWRNQAQVYDRQGKYEEAITSYHQALLSLVPTFSDSSYTAVPELEEYISPVDLLKTLRDKGDAMKAYAGQTGDRVMQQGALQTFQRAIDLVDILRREYQESSQQFWNEEIRPLVESAIDLAYTLYQREGEEAYLELAFRFAEKSKASLLAAAVQESAARNQAGIPDSLLEKEKQIKLDIAFYKERVFREKQKGQKANEDKILLWQSKILDRNRAYEALMVELESDFPVYFQLKYDEKTVGLDDIQEILPGDGALLEYFVGDDQSFAFLITPKEIKFRVLDHDIVLEDQLPAFIGQLRDRNQILEKGLSQELFQTYTSLAHGLYEGLIQPVLESPVKSLVVIPDGPLGYLPFELLLTQSSPEGAKVDYAALPYVLNESRVRYEYSATLLLFPLEDRKTSSSMIGFAPTYGQEVLAQARDAELFCEDPGSVNFGNLGKNQEEVRSVTKLLRGNSFLAQSATELTFKEQAGRHGILHLAMHGFVNQCNPLYSGLVFSQDGSNGQDSVRAPKMQIRSGPYPFEKSPQASRNDGFLHAYEIYAMQLNAELAVLSACNTGVGRLVQGEGIMSLARAFKYAGCPNIVTSLWQADDASTARIMETFYRHLEKGANKDEALQLAKLEYLQSSRRNHPFFWGTFILIGDDQPIPANGSSSYRWMLLLVLLIAGIGSGWWLRNRQRQLKTA